MKEKMFDLNQTDMKLHERNPVDGKDADQGLSWALLDWGLSFLESGRFSEAVKALEGIARLNPRDPLPWAAAALAAALQGDSERAQILYLELMARNPSGRLVRKLRPFFE